MALIEKLLTLSEYFVVLRVNQAAHSISCEQFVLAAVNFRKVVGNLIIAA